MARWAWLSYSITSAGPSVTVVGNTSSAAHLWLFWSTKKPAVKEAAMIRRGIISFCYPEWSFLFEGKVEQTEAGATLIHTFTLAPWANLETRWMLASAQTNLLIKDSTSPFFKYTNLILDFPYTGIWNYFYPFISIQNAGIITLGIRSQSVGGKGILYQTANYGESWAPLLDHTSFGGVGFPPTHYAFGPGGGHLVVINSTPYQTVRRAPALSGPWTTTLDTLSGRENFFVLPGIIWVSGTRAVGANYPRLHRSVNDGLNWGICFSISSLIAGNRGKIRVKSDESKGIIGQAGSSAQEQTYRSNNPGLAPGAWSALDGGIANRGIAPGVSFPRVVVAGATQYWYSLDSGLTGAYKAIPAGMQTTGSNHFFTSLEIEPFVMDRVLAAPYGAHQGLWLSTDFGVSWTQKLTDLGAGEVGVSWDEWGVGKAYAWGSAGFFRSDDFGETWHAKSAGLQLNQS